MSSYWRFLFIYHPWTT